MMCDVFCEMIWDGISPTALSLSLSLLLSLPLPHSLPLPSPSFLLWHPRKPKAGGRKGGGGGGGEEQGGARVAGRDAAVSSSPLLSLVLMPAFKEVWRISWIISSSFFSNSNPLLKPGGSGPAGAGSSAGSTDQQEQAAVRAAADAADALVEMERCAPGSCQLLLASLLGKLGR
ncbi:unnamed protein product [Closterium sp. NIES-54]